jgi:hypothetical protein
VRLAGTTPAEIAATLGLARAEVAHRIAAIIDRLTRAPHRLTASWS